MMVANTTCAYLNGITAVATAADLSKFLGINICSMPICSCVDLCINFQRLILVKSILDYLCRFL